MDNILNKLVTDLLNSIERRRISRLSRGSVRAQNGYYMSDAEWEKLKEGQEKRLHRVSMALYPEKYAH